MKRKTTSHGETVRTEVLKLRRQVPFQPFVIILRDGRRLPIRQPVNIALDPGEKRHRKASLEFCVISGDIQFAGSFETVADIVPFEKNRVP